MTSNGYLSGDDHFQTKAIHSAYAAEESATADIIPAISLTTTYKQISPGQPKTMFEYSRSGNPNRYILEKRIAALDGGNYGLCFGSGLAATTTLIHSFKAGDHVVCVDDVYGGTYRYLSKVASNFLIEVTYVGLEDAGFMTDKIKSNTKLIWLENPTNPLMKIVDIELICKIVHSVNPDILIAVDNTFLTSYFQKPLSLGADIVVYSASKYINGHSDVVMGAIVVNKKELYDMLLFYQNSCGAVPSPFDCYLVDRSIKTLGIRMELHMKNSLAVAMYLDAHPKIEKVLHPALPTHPGYETAKRQWSGFSGMMSFYVKGGLEETKTLLKNLKYFQCAESLGGFESLAEIPSLMTHASVPPDVRKTLGITDNLIRISVGLENTQDLIDDLKNGLDAV